MSKTRPLSFAVFDEFGRGADDRVQDHVAAEVARAVAAERERCAKVVRLCLSALAEELGAWDIDPPIHHVKEAHDACAEWLADGLPADRE